MARGVDEWIGKTDDAAIPARVRLRVFEAYGGVCQETGIKIMPGDAWDCDHAIALINGGEHRESNLRPVLKDAHKAKTKADLKTKSKNYRVRAKHVGVKQSKRLIPGSKGSGYRKKMDGTVVRVKE